MVSPSVGEVVGESVSDYMCDYVGEDESVGG